MTHVIGLPQNVFLIEDLLAAAVAADFDLMADHAHCVLLIGAGGSSIGVMKLGTITHATRIAYAGDCLDLAIQRHLYSQHSQWVSLYSCRQIKHAIGSLSESEFDKRWQEQVWDDQGNSCTLPLTAGDIKPALEKGLAALLAGGTAYLHELDIWLANQLDVPVRIAAEPDLLVVRGLKKVLVML